MRRFNRDRRELTLLRFPAAIHYRDKRRRFSRILSFFSPRRRARLERVVDGNHVERAR